MEDVKRKQDEEDAELNFRASKNQGDRRKDGSAFGYVEKIQYLREKV